MMMGKARGSKEGKREKGGRKGWRQEGEREREDEGGAGKEGE